MWSKAYFLISILSAFYITINDDASFSIVGENDFRIESGTYMLQKNGKQYLSTRGELIVTKVGSGIIGVDNLGSYSETKYHFRIIGKKLGPPIMVHRIT